MTVAGHLIGNVPKIDGVKSSLILSGMHAMCGIGCPFEWIPWGMEMWPYKLIRSVFSLMLDWTRYVVLCPDPLRSLKAVPRWAGLNIGGFDLLSRIPVEQASQSCFHDPSRRNCYLLLSSSKEKYWKTRSQIACFCYWREQQPVKCDQKTFWMLFLYCLGQSVMMVSFVSRECQVSDSGVRMFPLLT